MRILHIIQSLDPKSGGPPAIAMRLAAAQAQCGQQITLAAAIRDPSPSSLHVPGWAQVACHCGEDIAGAALEKLVVDADVVHIHGVWDPLLRRSATAAHRRGVPYVIAPHGMLDPWSLNQKRLKKKVALALMFRTMLQRAVFLHTGTAEEAHWLAPLRLRPPIEILPNGIFPEEFNNLPDAGTFRRGRPELGNHPYILFLGRLHHKKGLDYLADAFAEVSRKLPQAALVVAGPDDGERESFLRQIAAAGLNDRVHAVGPLYGNDKLAALVDAACFCLPSRQEGFSMAVLEALACGVPAVISEYCHFPEIASAGAGYVVPLGTDALAAALEKLLTDPQSARQMGAAGAALVRERYTWPHIAEVSIEAYRRHDV